MIVGPGNLYVQEAKRQLSARVGIDGFAGPSDLLVVLGAELAERDIALVALDLLAQAEHGAGSLVVAVASGAGLLDALAAALARLDAERPSSSRRRSCSSRRSTRGEALELADAVRARAPAS